MPRFAISTPTRSARVSLVALTLILTAACAKADRPADSSVSGAAASTPASSPAAGAPGASAHDSVSGMQGMQGMNMTGDPDRDFLRMMSDHHKGLILLAHMTKERKEGGTTVADATAMDAAQDKEIDWMQSMLEKDFKDPYAPKVLPDNQAMADELKGKSGTDYQRTFYVNVVRHHQQALKMIDDYLPKAKNTTVKQMAEKMKAAQAKEIAAFQKKIDLMK